MSINKENGNVKVSLLSDSPNKFELSVSVPKDNFMNNSLINDTDNMKTLEHNLKILEVNYIKLESSLKNMENTLQTLNTNIKEISHKLDIIFEYIDSNKN
jgi:septal ring factor EnvC (AmiA/AmiB activator)